MPELRQNLATKEWVIIATERAKRSRDFAEANTHPTIEAEPQYDPSCPFCPDNEELELEIERWPKKGSWQTRVIHNKYPALAGEGVLERSFDGVHRWISGVGHHQIVVDHPHHNTTWGLMTPAEIQAVLETFYLRGWAIREDPRIEQIVYFKNHGLRAGATLRHPHCQIIALPIVPHNIRQRIEEARRYFDDTGLCVYQEMLSEELNRAERIVATTEHFVAFVLYAATGPFNIWILPRYQSVSFLYSRPEELEDLARILQDVLRRLYVGLRDPSYNLIIRTAPVKEIGNAYLNWYITIVPRLSRAAGFELGSGMFINPTLPEESAEFLRAVEI
jgi:UDPglucose--hexose-1-phosphate uridylyltransferase